MDVFQYGICERLSPEAPVPVFKPTNMKENLGMAGNVYDNLKSLGVDAKIYSRTGIKKTRFVDEISNQILLRVDQNDTNENISLHVLHDINFSEYDAVIISDYNKGFLEEDDISYIANQCKYANIPSFLDTKKQILDSFIKNIDFIKINEKEFNENYTSKEFGGYLIITLGKKGAQIQDFTDKKIPKFTNISIKNEHPVRDLSGAGDTFLAALAVEYINVGDIKEAVKFANKCASWVVTQKGVVPVDIKKI
jgi:D-beta-D-heptose 7-phosphate kinase/D-beta-D-heptose 1-phosphate adenosyltransferase